MNNTDPIYSMAPPGNVFPGSSVSVDAEKIEITGPLAGVVADAMKKLVQIMTQTMDTTPDASAGVQVGVMKALLHPETTNGVRANALVVVDRAVHAIASMVIHANITAMQKSGYFPMYVAFADMTNRLTRGTTEKDNRKLLTGAVYKEALELGALHLGCSVVDVD